MADGRLEIDGLPVDLVESPTSLQELSQILKRASNTGTTVTPVGGGTKLSLGNTPRSVGIAIETGSLRGVIEYEPDNMTVSVQAGTPLQELQQVLAQANQFLPLDPPHPGKATVGGLVACNTSGPIRFRYGTLRDMLIGVKIVHADGTITKAGGKLVKNVTGYDMCKLYTGSLGTLGILGELTFKVWSKPEALSTMFIACPTFSTALKAAQSLLKADLLPDALEVWNANAFRRLAGEELGSSWALLVRFGEVPQAVRWQVERARGIAKEAQGSVLRVIENGNAEEFWVKAASARELSDGGDEVAIKCSVLFQSAAETARRMEETAGRLGARLSLFCHAGNYVLYGRYQWQDADPDFEKLLLELRCLRAYCTSVNGHMIVEKVPPEIKRGFDVWGYEAKALGIMRKIKQEFDPKGLLNPGRFVGGI